VSSGTAASSLAQLPGRYRVVLSDIWGCVHDGVHVFPEAQALLSRWRSQGRIVLLITNAPRPAGAVRAQLDRLGLDPASYDGIVTSGDTGLAALRAEGRSEAGFIGTAADRRIIEETGLRLLDGPQSDAVVCTGLEEGKADAAEYDPVLAEMRVRGAHLHCFNPDRVVLRGPVREPCAGAIAERYEAIGGRVTWYGKPYAPIYARALVVAGEKAGRTVEPAEVVAVGDSIRTDLVGAADAGLDFVFVTHGIEGDRIDSEGSAALIARFAEEHGMSLPAPIATAPRLA